LTARAAGRLVDHRAGRPSRWPPPRPVV